MINWFVPRNGGPRAANFASIDGQEAKRARHPHFEDGGPFSLAVPHQAAASLSAPRLRKRRPRAMSTAPVTKAQKAIIVPTDRIVASG